MSGIDKVRAKEELDKLCRAFGDLGIPLSADKIVGPAREITYLGISINSIEMTISVPDDKYGEILELLPKWWNRKTCTKQELQSLVGKLNFVCQVVRPGRTFLRRLIDLIPSVKKTHHHINLNAEARADLEWWMEFLPQWNRRSIIPDSLEIVNTDFKLFSDASATIGFGAIWGKAWVQGRWSAKNSHWSIDTKELFAILAEVVTRGHMWAGRRLVMITDNLPITQAWQAGTSKSKELMAVLRKIFLLAAKGGFCISLKHIFGHHNTIADSLSRFKVQQFRRLHPDADPIATKIPMEVWNL